MKLYAYNVMIDRVVLVNERSILEGSNDVR